MYVWAFGPRYPSESPHIASRRSIVLPILSSYRETTEYTPQYNQFIIPKYVCEGSQKVHCPPVKCEINTLLLPSYSLTLTCA